MEGYFDSSETGSLRREEFGRRWCVIDYGRSEVHPGKAQGFLDRRRLNIDSLVGHSAGVSVSEGPGDEGDEIRSW